MDQAFIIPFENVFFYVSGKLENEREIVVKSENKWV